MRRAETAMTIESRDGGFGGSGEDSDEQAAEVCGSKRDRGISCGTLSANRTHHNEIAVYLQAAGEKSSRRGFPGPGK